MKNTPQRRREPARGFAAATALFAIGLFLLLGSVASITARNNGKVKLFHDTKDQMVAQSDLILNTLLLCRAIYPAGDNGTGNFLPYPATPADGKVASLTCPGQPGESIWSGDARAMAPRALPGFSAWDYENSAAGVRISITASASNDTFYQDLLDAVVRRIGAAQAVRNGNTLTITLID